MRMAYRASLVSQYFVFVHQKSQTRKSNVPADLAYIKRPAFSVYYGCVYRGDKSLISAISSPNALPTFIEISWVNL
jgi:hypothetical protein